MGLDSAFLLTLATSQSNSEGNKGRNSRRDSEVGTDRGHGGTLLLASSSPFAQSAFLYSQIYLPRGVALHMVGWGPPTSIINQGSTPYTCLQGGVMETFLLRRESISRQICLGLFQIHHPIRVTAVVLNRSSILFTE